MSVPIYTPLTVLHLRVGGMRHYESKVSCPRTQFCSQRLQPFWLTPRMSQRIKTSGKNRNVSKHQCHSGFSYSMHVQKPLSTLNICTQSNQNQDFLFQVFDFVQSVGRSVTTDRNCVGSRNKIAVLKPRVLKSGVQSTRISYHQQNHFNRFIFQKVHIILIVG